MLRLLDKIKNHLNGAAAQTPSYGSITGIMLNLALRATTFNLVLIAWAVTFSTSLRRSLTSLKSLSFSPANEIEAPPKLLTLRSMKPLTQTAPPALTAQATATLEQPPMSVSFNPPIYAFQPATRSGNSAVQPVPTEHPPQLPPALKAQPSMATNDDAVAASPAILKQ